MKKRPIVYHTVPSSITNTTITQVDQSNSNNIVDISKKIEEKKKRIPVVRELPSSFKEAIIYNEIESRRGVEIKEERKKKKKCIARVTTDTVSEYFADGRHKFYMEFRCNYPCFENRDVCIKCLQKKASCSIQSSRLFEHGMIYEPIPDQSHIFGGKWYQEHCKKWGAPPSEIIEFAIEHQQEARGNYEVIQPNYEFSISKAKQPSNSQEMPPRKKAPILSDEKQEEVPKVKRGRKPKIMTLNDLPSITELALPESDPTKCIPQTSKIVPEKVKDPPKPKKRVIRKKSEPSPYESLVQTQALIYKDVSIPTHMEESLEEFDIDGYEIEYIKLSTITIGLTSYFRDPIKNKLYKKIKDKIVGEYLGRYDPLADNGILSDIPDSDDEKEDDE
jgi:hypothetical protein